MNQKLFFHFENGDCIALENIGVRSVILYSNQSTKFKYKGTLYSICSRIIDIDNDYAIHFQLSKVRDVGEE